MGFPRGSAVRNPPAMQETREMWVRSLGQGDPLEEEVATSSSILARTVHGGHKLETTELACRKGVGEKGAVGLRSKGKRVKQLVAEGWEKFHAPTRNSSSPSVYWEEIFHCFEWSPSMLAEPCTPADVPSISVTTVKTLCRGVRAGWRQRA